MGFVSYTLSATPEDMRDMRDLFSWNNIEYQCTCLDNQMKVNATDADKAEKFFQAMGINFTKN